MFPLLLIGAGADKNPHLTCECTPIVPFAIEDKSQLLVDCSVKCERGLIVMLAEVRSNATDRCESQRVNQQKMMQRDSSGEVAEHLAAERTGHGGFRFLSLNDYWMKSVSMTDDR